LLRRIGSGEAFVIPLHVNAYVVKRNEVKRVTNAAIGELDLINRDLFADDITARLSGVPFCPRRLSVVVGYVVAVSKPTRELKGRKADDRRDQPGVFIRLVDHSVKALNMTSKRSGGDD
jgi:hypothetical protein